MNKSEQINELATALAKVQSELTDAHKGKQGYGYKYAELSQILDIGRPVLSKHGLSVTQLCGNTSPETISVETVLMHSSGQWISEVLEMVVERQLNEKGKGMSKAQAAGSVITYARRYAYAAIVGIAQTDTDAAAEVETPHKSIKVAQRYVTPVATIQKASEAQCQKLKGLLNGPEDNEYLDKCLEKAKASCLGELQSYQIEAIIKKLSTAEDKQIANA